jgi:plasmid stabilization system protein ParE
MVFKVIFSPRAIERLESVVRYIARDNPGAAEHFGMRLIEQAQLLGDFPALGSPYRKRPGVRRLLCKPYFIYYRVKEREQVVEVLDYWHSAREEPESL